MPHLAQSPEGFPWRMIVIVTLYIQLWTNNDALEGVQKSGRIVASDVFSLETSSMVRHLDAPFNKDQLRKFGPVFPAFL